MDMHIAFGVLSACFALASFVPYIHGLYRGQLQPHVFTWALWALMTGIGLAAQIVEGAGPGAWMMAMSMMFCTGVAVWAVRHGTTVIVRADWACLAGALAAIGLWVVTDNPLWSVVLISVIDGVAFIPTMRKSWHKPWQESWVAFALGSVGFGFSLLAMERVNLITALYPVTLIVLNTGFVVLVLSRRRALGVA